MSIRNGCIIYAIVFGIFQGVVESDRVPADFLTEKFGCIFRKCLICVLVKVKKQDGKNQKCSGRWKEHEQRLLPEFFQKFLHKNPHINHLYYLYGDFL